MTKKESSYQGVIAGRSHRIIPASAKQTKRAAGRPRPPSPPRRGLDSTSSCRVRGAPTRAWVSLACEAGWRGAARTAVGSQDPQPPSPLPAHTHTHLQYYLVYRALPISCRRARLLQSEVFLRPVLRARVSSNKAYDQSLRSKT